LTTLLRVIRSNLLSLLKKFLTLLTQILSIEIVLQKIFFIFKVILLETIPLLIIFKVTALTKRNLRSVHVFTE
jgi:hypothetical protein